MLISNLLKKVHKNSIGKRYLQKCDLFTHFFTFTHVHKFVLLITFCVKFYETFSTDFKQI